MILNPSYDNKSSKLYSKIFLFMLIIFVKSQFFIFENNLTRQEWKDSYKSKRNEWHYMLRSQIKSKANNCQAQGLRANGRKTHAGQILTQVKRSKAFSVI